MATYKIENAPQLSNLNEFRSMLGRNINFSKASRFSVSIGRINNLFQDLIYMCETAELPGRAFNMQDFRYYGPTFRMPVQSEYTEINFSFYVNDAMKEKELFDRWMNFINPKNTYDFRFRNQYSTDIAIYQYSEVGEDNTGNREQTDIRVRASYKATLRQAYPINVQAMPLSWAEDNIHRLQVTFNYTDWVTIPESKEKSDKMSEITPF